MRKAITMVCLLLTTLLLTGCARQPDLAGRWETSLDETLCATVLWLNGDGSFTNIQEGRSIAGTWSLKDDRLTLTIAPVNKMDSGGMFTCTLDRATGTLVTHDGLHLHRQPDPDIDGYWYDYSDGRPIFSSLHLMDSGFFIREDSDLSSLSFDGGTRTTGKWSLGGLVLTLRGDDGTLLTYRLNPDCTAIDIGNGILLKKYTEN